MKKYDVNQFNQEMRLRTARFAVNIFKTMNSVRFNELSKIPVKQLVRCSSSVAANYSSATRGRSEAEFYSKLCIVAEECDESLFWIDFLTETGILQASEVSVIRKEALELTSIFSTIRKKLKQKLYPS